MYASPSRQVILDRLSVRPSASTPLPEFQQSRLVQYNDPLAKFNEILTMVGGRVHCVDDKSDIGLLLTQMPNSARQRGSQQRFPAWFLVRMAAEPLNYF